MDTREAMLALDAKQSAERDLAAAAHCPAWRHGVFGIMMGAMVASPAVALPWRYFVLAFALAAIPLIVRSDRKRTGMFINGYRRGKTRLVTFAILAALLVLYTLSVRAALSNGDHLTPLLLGIAAAVLATLGSIQWQRVFVREMGA
ncbi:hypothetical protein H9L12_10415 [Sphingomonas rhizophila]|uniref:Uncharacterized protein n=1 Tax=Sphingomonas rhizophila TaxID=2071607 RepID=A0A7G9SA03_9SPHN|nr:hypothetical protein [Sphingomonas rhizophila]QNN64678.1 hypothetical protein H9L12_10415 [Sphingomonas rhizophila]